MIKPLLKIPPFQDAHIHFMEEGLPVNPNEVTSIAKAYLSRGILSVRDMGHKSGLGLECKKSNHDNSGILTIQSAGFALHKRDTYGGFLGKGVSGKKEIEAAVRSLAEVGADFIKVINSGIVSGQIENPVSEGGFSSEEWKVIQGEAERHHLKICCHANSDRSIRQAVDFGVSSIEHGFFISQETLCRMAEQGVGWTPTVSALQSIIPFIPVEAQGYLNRIVDGHLESVHYAVSQGVNLAVGTDSGSKGVQAGKAFWAELRLYRKAGLSFDQILAAACPNRGEIEKGTYLLAEKNFIDLGKVEAVFVKGIPIKQREQFENSDQEL